MRSLPIDLSELVLAMSLSDSLDASSMYLDLETGEVVRIPSEIATVDEMSDEDIAELPEWEKEIVPLALKVLQNPGRYEPIPHRESRDGYRLMVDFIGTVEDSHVQEVLYTAIRGKGAFRRFKDALIRHPADRERWFEFENKHQEEAAHEWLKELGIEAVPPVK